MDRRGDTLMQKGGKGEEGTLTYPSNVETLANAKRYLKKEWPRGGLLSLYDYFIIFY